MREFVIVITAIISLTSSGCSNYTVQELSATPQSNESENIAESIANTEYDSIEDFLENSNSPVFMMDSKQLYNEIATNSNAVTSSNASTFSFVDTNVSVAQSYISVTYECEADGDTFRVDLATYPANNGKEQLAYIVDANPGLFAEDNIAGISLYYCPGSEYDWFDCYAMVIDNKMFLVDIEKGYNEYVETVLNNIVLQ